MQSIDRGRLPSCPHEGGLSTEEESCEEESWEEESCEEESCDSL